MLLHLGFRFHTLNENAAMFDKSLKIGIIGSGIVGRVLGNAFLQEGSEVMLGTRNPAKKEAVEWQEQNTRGRLGSFEDAAVFGDVLIVATKGSVVLAALDQAGVQHFSNKILIDTTNPIGDGPPVHGVLPFFTSTDASLMESIQKHLPEARVVKAFNSVGNGLMYRPALPGGKPSMFICGNDSTAKETVRQILDRFGWETEDLGMVEAARAIEPLCMLWCIPAILNNSWNHAFKLLKA